MPEQYTITGTITPVGDADRTGIRVQAFDRDLPSLERRTGSSPQLLGETITDAKGRFEITYTLEQFQSSEGNSMVRWGQEKNADISFRVFDRAGQALDIQKIEALDAEYGPNQIIFNAPTFLKVNIFIDAPQAVGDSEYEQLIALIAPAIEDLPLTELSDEDVAFLINELGLEQKLETQQRIEWLRRCALLAQETNLPIEAFYGWGRKELPTVFAELAATPLKDLPLILGKLTGFAVETLRIALLEAIKQNIIPAIFSTRVDEIVRQLKRRDQVLHQVTGQLLDEETKAVLAGYTVTTFDQNDGEENLGLDITDNEGRFSFAFFVDKALVADAPFREFRLEVLTPEGEKLPGSGHISVNPNQPQTIIFPAFIPVPKPEISKLQEQFKKVLLDVPSNLRVFLDEKQNIKTLADIRRKGGLSHFTGLPVSANSTVIRKLESLADLDRISPDVSMSTALLNRNFDSVLTIADTPHSEFIEQLSKGDAAVSVLDAAKLHVMASTQTHLLDNMLLRMATNNANGSPVEDGDAAAGDFQQPCGCADCQAAVSPVAYLTMLLDYALKHVRTRNVKIDLQFLVDTFHQPFIDLPTDCEAVEKQLRQVRICIEVLRSYLEEHLLAGSLKEAVLAKEEMDYTFAVYVLMLSRIGTSYEEIRRIRSETDEKRKALAERLGIDLISPRPADPPGDELDRLFFDVSALPSTPHALNEQVLEEIFGFADTTRDPLSEGAKRGDDKGQITRWNLNGAEWNQNTDPEGMVHVTLVNPAPTVFRVEVYQDRLRTKLVAAGEIATPQGTVKLVAKSNSHLSGVVEIAYAAGSTVISIAAIPVFLSWQLQHLRTLWSRQDHPVDAYSDEASPQLPIIDPDLIGPDDFRNPVKKAKPADPDKAFDIWLRRRIFIDKTFTSLQSDRETKGLNQILLKVLGNPLPKIDDLLLVLTKGGTADEIKAAKDNVAALALSLESFTRLMAIRSKDQLAQSDTRNDKVSEQEWREVYSILTQATKVKQYAAWRIEEQNAGTEMGPKEFWFSVSEPKEGDWPTMHTANQPLIDPDIIKPAALPDWLAGEAALVLWNTRKARLEQIPTDLKTEREANGFEAMLQLALGDPTPGDALQHDLNTLKNDLINPDGAIRGNATKQIETDLHLTVENFNRLMVIKAADGQADPAIKPTATDFAEIYAILTPARKFKHEYPTWIQEENTAGLVYWMALKAKLPLWRAGPEFRQVWQQALRSRSQSPIIDPMVMGADDLRHVIPGDPAFDVWKSRYGQLTILRDDLRTTREGNPDTLAGFNQILQDTIGFDSIVLKAIDQERQAGYSIEKRLEQLNLLYGTFTYLMRIQGLAEVNQPITDSEWNIVYASLAQVKMQREFASFRAEEQGKHILLSSDSFKIPETLLTPLPFLDLATPRWLSTWQARRDWQDTLQSRIDQENTAAEGLASAVSAVEESTLPVLRDALIRASDAAGADIGEKAKWITARLLIDVQSGGCQMTTRVAQAIETIQLLLFGLRSGQVKKREEWILLQNSLSIRPGSILSSAAFITGGTRDSVLAVTGDDHRIYSTIASRMFDGPWTHVGAETNHTIPADARPSLLTLETKGKAYLFATDDNGRVNFSAARPGIDDVWTPWAVIGDIQVRTNASIIVAAEEQAEILHVFVVQEDGLVFGNWHDTQWHDWMQIGNATFRIPANATIAAASLSSAVHLFVTGNDGKIYRTQVSSDLAEDWAPIDIAGTVTFLPGASISVTGARTGDAFVELIAVDKEGGIYRTSWNEMIGDWTAWSREGTLTIPSNATVTLIGEVGSLRLFTTGNDGKVYARTAMDWEPIGDTAGTTGLPVTARLDSTGGIHLYLANENQIFTTSQSTPGVPWNFSIFWLTLLAPWFDEEWKWIGSYATYRSAMFVYLYPENILQPSLLKNKTPAFEKLVTDTRGTRLNSESACRQAKTYADYFSDICSLKIEATCQASTIRYTGESCNRRPSKPRSMFYMFGRAKSGKIYWSAYDVDSSSASSGQTIWQEIKVFGDTKIIRIIGAMPYFRYTTSYIHLFCITGEILNKHVLQLVRLSLDNLGEWDPTTYQLDIPPPLTHGFYAVLPVQTSFSQGFLPPELIFYHPYSSFDKFYCRRLDLNGTAWEGGASGWDSFLNIIPHNREPWTEIKAALIDRHGMWLIKRERHDPDYYSAIFLPKALEGEGKTIEIDEDANQGISGSILGVVLGKESTTTSHIYVFWKQENSNTNKYQCIKNAINRNPPSQAALADLIEIPPNSGGSQKNRTLFSEENSQRMLVLERQKKGKAFYIYQYAESDARLAGSAMIRALPQVQAPLNVPLHLSATDLQQRRLQIIDAFALNADATPSILHYLREAYYFVPLHLALGLHSAGQYLASLDCFRTVYDYEAESDSPNLRNIYYGLELDAKLPNVTLYHVAENWLLDPLDPHALAATRHFAYTRFTLVSLVRCLLDFADSEFTHETGESLVRARTLYLTALELLSLPELQQKLGNCNNLIAELKIEPGQNIPPEAPIIINRVLEDLTRNTGFSYDYKAGIIEELKHKLIERAGWNEKLADIRVIANKVIADAPLPFKIGSAIASKSSILKNQYALVVTQPHIDSELQVISKTVASRTYNEIEHIDKAIQSNIGIKQQALLSFSPPLTTPSLKFCIPPNPILKALRLHAELNLYKLRNCRNIAGLKRQLDPYAAPTDTVTGLPAIGLSDQLILPGISALQPSHYRYPALIERAKQLVQLSAQIEAEMLSALINRDAAAQNMLQARQQLSLRQADVRLQDLRVVEANDSVKLVDLQQDRIQTQIETYDAWLQKGANQYENEMITAYGDAAGAQKGAAEASRRIQQKQLLRNFASLVAQNAMAGGIVGAAFAGAFGSAELNLDFYYLNSLSQDTKNAIDAATAAQIASVNAALERKHDEWQLQKLLAEQDLVISNQQKIIANDHVQIATQERVIAGINADNAKDMVEFLSTKFLTVELYDWMSNTLEEVYRFFLQQATAMARLGQIQLAFERQEAPPVFINSDYWKVPSENGGLGNGSTIDRRGLTGSARLLQDIYQLDQYAFTTDKRKLSLTKTISLARLAPVEFERFRETGIMTFATSFELFDRGFPGHYLRLIKRVRTSVIALVPPINGIHATLSTTGLSRVVIGGDVFQTVPIRRAPEFVVMSSPDNSTGVFELDPQPGMLSPFEGSGVATNWEFNMPRAANPFDYRAIADVLITLEYTALYSFDYRQQVIQSLNPIVSADRPFSFRNQFADQWYDLHNPDMTSTPMTVRFKTFREDFPPNIDLLKIQQILLYFIRADDKLFEVSVSHLHYTAQGEVGAIGGGANSIDGIISTRRGNAGSWTAMIGKSPAGEWELALPNTEEMKNRFKNEEIVDMLMVITYSGRTPEWPS